MKRTIQLISRKFKKNMRDKYVGVLVLNNYKRSKYFKIINMPTHIVSKPSKLLDNHVGWWKPKKI